MNEPMSATIDPRHLDPAGTLPRFAVGDLVRVVDGGTICDHDGQLMTVTSVRWNDNCGRMYRYAITDGSGLETRTGESHGEDFMREEWLEAPGLPRVGDRAIYRGAQERFRGSVCEVASLDDRGASCVFPQFRLPDGVVALSTDHYQLVACGRTLTTAMHLADVKDTIRQLDRAIRRSVLDSLWSNPPTKVLSTVEVPAMQVNVPDSDPNLVRYIASLQVIQASNDRFAAVNAEQQATITGQCVQLANARHKRTELQRQLDEKCVVIGRLFPKLRDAQQENGLIREELARATDALREWKRLYEERRTPLRRTVESVSALGDAVATTMFSGTRLLGRGARATVLAPVRAARAVGRGVARSWSRSRVGGAICVGTMLALGGSMTFDAVQLGYNRYLAMGPVAPTPVNANDPRERAWIEQRAVRQATSVRCASAQGDLDAIHRTREQIEHLDRLLGATPSQR